MPVSYGRIDPRVLGITRTVLLRSARVLDAARERAEITWETLRVRSTVTVEVRHIQAALAALEMQRRDLLFTLGDATHRSDERAAEEAQKLLAELDARESDLQAQLRAQVEAAAERIREAKLSVGKTVVAPPRE